MKYMKNQDIYLGSKVKNSYPRLEQCFTAILYLAKTPFNVQLTYTCTNKYWNLVRFK